MEPQAPKLSNLLTAILIVLVLALLFFYVIPGGSHDGRLQEAANDIGSGFHEASRDLHPEDQTTGEKLGKAVKHAGQSIENAAQ